MTYPCTEILILFFVKNLAVILGFLWIMLAVEVKLLTSKEEKQDCKVGFLWMR